VHCDDSNDHRWDLLSFRVETRLFLKEEAARGLSESAISNGRDTMRAESGRHYDQRLSLHSQLDAAAALDETPFKKRRLFLWPV
jgi:hypothetical protein